MFSWNELWSIVLILTVSPLLAFWKASITGLDRCLRHGVRLVGAEASRCRWPCRSGRAARRRCRRRRAGSGRRGGAGAQCATQEGARRDTPDRGGHEAREVLGLGGGAGHGVSFDAARRLTSASSSKQQERSETIKNELRMTRRLMRCQEPAGTVLATVWSRSSPLCDDLSGRPPRAIARLARPHCDMDVGYC